jgi:hypothetical protein
MTAGFFEKKINHLRKWRMLCVGITIDCVPKNECQEAEMSSKEDSDVYTVKNPKYCDMGRTTRRLGQ